MGKTNNKTTQNAPQAPNTALYGQGQGNMPFNAEASKMDELRARASQELQMLQRAQEYEQMQAQIPPKIDSAAVRKASKILQKYKDGKARLEQKIVANEEFWKLRQWKYMEDGESKEFKPATAWLWSCMESRYSDIMDSYPTCNFRPREKGDKAEAKKLSAIVPVIFEQNRYEDVYSDVARYTLKHGGCCQGIFWDGSKHNGLGDIAIKKIDFINLFWEPGITNIQESQNLFNTELVSNDILTQRYPQCEGKLGGKKLTLAKYLYDDNVDTSDKSVVVDWYYHTYVRGKKTLQYVKYVNDIVLYATENETKRPTKTIPDVETGLPLIIPDGESMAERGLYDHALYPFVAMPLYPVEGSICGYGLTDIGRDTQMIIDRLNYAISKNAIVGSKPRYFVKNDGTVNEEEYADENKDFVHVEGNIGDENIRPIDTMNLDSIYVNFLTQKIDELKYITSNQDSNNGVAPSGVTAASAIAALQETAGKNARSTNKTFHRAYREVCYQVVELIRQFYTIPRTFRIMSEDAKEEFVEFDNSGLLPQEQATMGMDMGLRLPEFDIEVTTEKANPYKKMEINELALSFYNAGFFNPQMCDQALACLDMMDFTKKDEIMTKIQTNGTLQQMLLQYQQMALQYAQLLSPVEGEKVANLILTQSGQPVPQQVGLEADPSVNGESEHPYVEKARENARGATQAD